MANDRQKLFEMVDRMPTFSQSVVRIIDLASDIDTAPKDLVRLVENDPILTLKVLRLVNSAYFGLSKPVTSIKQGVVYVGINTIKHLAVSIAAIGALPRTNNAGFDMNDFWTHSLVTAAVAKLLAQHRGVPRGDATRHFVAGLLHDIGQVVLAQFMPAEYQPVLERSRLAEGLLAALEQDALGTTHAEVGAVLAEHWKLPAELVAAIRHHHDAAALAQAGALEFTVFVANQVAKLQVDESQRLSAVEELPGVVSDWLRMPLVEVAAELPGLAIEIENARSFINLPEQGGRVKVVMRGCRGSTPVPGVETLRYGGNTTCIEVVTKAGDHLIFDAGTGIRRLGLELMAHPPVRCAIFISHTHWDHIQGLPFFVPLFVPGSKVEIYGSFDPVYHKSLADILAQQMQYCYFPVREAELKAEIAYTSLRERGTIRYGSATVTNIVLNHPVLNYGYKVEADGGCFVFSGDYEPPVNIYDESEEEFEDYAEMIALQQQRLREFLGGVDALVIDAQYTDAEYAGKRGWGHGTYGKGIALAEAAGIPRVFLTHHDPTRTDAALDAIHAELLAARAHRVGGPEIVMASEGLCIEL